MVNMMLIIPDYFHIPKHIRRGTCRHWQTSMWMTSSVAGAVRIMPAVGHGLPGTSTGVIETDSVFSQPSVIKLRLDIAEWLFQQNTLYT